jgi:glycosyltransferase involved in cell wall biosynthesis
MAENSITLLKDKKLWEQFSENAFVQAKKFDLDKILPMYEKLYKQTLASEIVAG